MPIFKIQTTESQRKLCKAESVAEIIQKAKLKFDLNPDVTYKVVLEEDGTEIDDEILIDYANQCKEALLLLIISNDTSWEELKKQKENVNYINQSTIPIRSEDAGPSLMKSATSSHETVHNIVDLQSGLWSKIPERVFNACERNEEISPGDRRIIVSTIANYMVEELKDTSSKRARQIATMLCTKYSNSFAAKVGNVNWSDGIDSLQLSIYNAVLYRNSLKGKGTKTKKRTSNEVDDSDGEDVTRREQEEQIIFKQDCYGCVDYSPDLPTGENKESLESYRLELISLINNGENIKRVLELLDLTYPLVRALLNEATRDLTRIFEEWTCLTKPFVLIEHSNRLLGKEIEQTWDASLQSKCKYLRRYVKSQLPKAQKNCSAYQSILDECKNACHVRKDVVPKILVVFPILLKYFNEKTEFLYKVIDGKVSDDEVVDNVDFNHPTLIIRGSSLYDENSLTDVILEKKFIIRSTNALQGLLITFLCYYIFGYSYAPEARKTLEFIQRFFLLINPATGSKQGKSKKRRTQTYDPAVYKLAQVLASFSNEFNVKDN